jgi:hypothetical protein
MTVECDFPWALSEADRVFVFALKALLDEYTDLNRVTVDAPVPGAPALE